MEAEAGGESGEHGFAGVCLGQDQDLKSAAKQLKMLSQKINSFDALFGNSTEFLDRIMLPVSAENLETADVDFVADLICSIRNLLLSTEKSKKVIGEHSRVIPILIQSLNLKLLPMEAKVSAAESLELLWEVESNKKRIKEDGWMNALLGHQTSYQKGINDSMTPLCNLNAPLQLPEYEDLTNLEKFGLLLNFMKNTKISRAQETALRSIHSLVFSTVPLSISEKDSLANQMLDHTDAAQTLVAFGLFGDSHGEIPQLSTNSAKQILVFMGMKLDWWEKLLVDL